MNNWARLGVAFVAASLLPACATVVRGTKTTYSVASTPSGADVAFSTGQQCVTPCKMKLKRKEGFTATVTMPGYRTETARVESKLSGGGGAAAAGNILVGGIIGGIVDGTNGSLNSFFPRALDLMLTPVQVMGAYFRPNPRTQLSATGPSVAGLQGTDLLSASERYEQALKAAQPVRGGDPKQGWTVSD